MMQKPTEIEQSTDTYKFALWTWTLLISALTGIALGYAFGEEGAISGWWVVWGVLAGALSTLPLWALYGLGKRILHNLVKLRTDLAAVSAPSSTAPPTV